MSNPYTVEAVQVWVVRLLRHVGPTPNDAAVRVAHAAAEALAMRDARIADLLAWTEDLRGGRAAVPRAPEPPMLTDWPEGAGREGWTADPVPPCPVPCEGECECKGPDYDRTPEGYVNNCGLRNGLNESDCTVCEGVCPDAGRLTGVPE